MFAVSSGYITACRGRAHDLATDCYSNGRGSMRGIRAGDGLSLYAMIYAIVGAVVLFLIIRRSGGKRKLKSAGAMVDIFFDRLGSTIPNYKGPKWKGGISKL